MSVILTKVIYTSSSDEDKVDFLLPAQPVFKQYGNDSFTLFLPRQTSITARLRLIREFIRRGYKLESISEISACHASFRKEA